MVKPTTSRPGSSKPRSRNFLKGLDPTARLIFLSLGLLSLGVLLGLVWTLLEQSRTYKLTLAAGSRDGESYILSKAIEQVVEAEHPHIQIEVVETEGTSANIKQLESGAAQLATAQADVPAGPRSRLVVGLYSDSFQLIVKENSSIRQFSDLAGKRIGLWRKGGQYRSFLEVASHYGFTANDFTFVGTNQEESNNAFRQNQVEAIFRVRALGNPSILEMVQKYRGRLVPIEQAAAMRLKYPAFEPSEIPRGAYRGSNPTVPDADLPTISVQRTLLASSKLDAQVVQDITETLDTQRQDLAKSIPDQFADVRPLVASIKPPEITGGTGIPPHPGAIAYFDRDKPSFIQEYADFVGLLLTLTLLLGSWLWQLKSWLERRQKNEADSHIGAAIELMTQVQNKQTAPEVALDELDKIFAQAADDLIQEKISQESFRTLSEAYKAVRDVIEHKGKLEDKLAKQGLQQQR
jgi:TRAP transporter TAXI family solute receptor